VEVKPSDHGKYGFPEKKIKKKKKERKSEREKQQQSRAAASASPSIFTCATTPLR